MPGHYITVLGWFIITIVREHAGVLQVMRGLSICASLTKPLRVYDSLGATFKNITCPNRSGVQETGPHMSTCWRSYRRALTRTPGKSARLPL